MKQSDGDFRNQIVSAPVYTPGGSEKLLQQFIDGDDSAEVHAARGGLLVSCAGNARASDAIGVGKVGAEARAARRLIEKSKTHS